MPSNQEWNSSYTINNKLKWKRRDNTNSNNNNKILYLCMTVKLLTPCGIDLNSIFVRILKQLTTFWTIKMCRKKNWSKQQVMLSSYFKISFRIYLPSSLITLRFLCVSVYIFLFSFHSNVKKRRKNKQKHAHTRTQFSFYNQ